jgi:hypothetical protein
MDTQAEKKKRRSKKDAEGRTHTCECGKSYLSYQALYTHRRTKHADPVKTEAEAKKKRGRPKGVRSISSFYDPATPLGEHVLATRISAWKENKKPTCCDDVFAEFLIEKSKLLSKKDYRNIAYSITNLRTCINKHYHEMIESSLDYLEEYTTMKNAALIPKISNIYILDFLPKNNIGFDKDFEVQFMFEFCSWLTKKTYTDLEVSLLSESLNN